MFANSVFGVLSWFSPIVLGFVSTPIMVRGLGAETYGVYALILGFLSYSFTFGIGRAASKYVAEYSASAEPELLSRSLSAVLIFSVAVGVIGACVLALVTPFVVSDVLQLPENLRPSAETGLYIACVTGLMTMISLVFQSTLQGTHRFGTYLSVSSIGALMLSAGNIALALAGYGIEALIAWNLFSTLTIGTIFFVAALKAVPDFRLTFSIDRGMTKSVVRYGSSIILYQIFANALFVLERTLVVRRFGPEALTYYAVPMLLGIYLHGAISSFALALFPRMNELLGDREELVRFYKKVNRPVIALIILIATSLIINGKQFLALWVGAKMSETASEVLIFHVVTFSLIGAGVIAWQIAESYRAAGINVAMTFIWLIVGGGLMLTMIDIDHGIEGVAAARLIPVVLTTPVIFFVEKRFLGSVQTGYWAALLARTGLAGLCMAAFQITITKLVPAGWPELLTALIGGTVIYVIVLFLTGFFERDEIERVLRAISMT
jgi:O-antigen/teichoic acid export membrane protein